MPFFKQSGLPLTKIRITGFENIEPKLRLQLGKAIKLSGFDKTLRQEYVQHIKKNGFNASLSPATIRSRKILSLFNTTDPEYQDAKANLTFTGELWKKLRSNFLVSRLAVTLIAPSTRHKPYETASTTGKALRSALEKRNKAGNVEQLQFKEFQKKRRAAAPKISDIFGWQSERYDFTEPFRNKSFLDNLTIKLKDSILKFFRN